MPRLIFFAVMLSAFLFTLSSVKYLQILQLEGYVVNSYIKKLFCAFFGLILLQIAFGVIFLSLIIILPRAELTLPVISLLLLLISYGKKQKCPFRLTARAKRLTLTLLLLYIIECAIAISFRPEYLALILAAQPIAVWLAGVIIAPVERKINLRFIARARQKLRKIKPKVIAITGSYGKTTTKNILSALLSEKYSVLATPGSYNTPQGVSKTVNDLLNQSHQILVVEMGARKEGDIKELTEMVEPNIAIITAVGNQHLGSFGSLEKIKKTKRELIDYLPCGGRAYFNGNDKVAAEFYQGFNGSGTLTGKNGRVYYDEVTLGKNGTSFTLHYVGGSERVTTKLLGKHIPETVCLCAAVALDLGISIKSIKNALESVKPVAHRLEIIYNVDSVIIDDSYNSNEQGFISAIEVTSYFSYLIKVVITPGVVELGKAQYEVNFRLGNHAGRVCDHLIVYGENATALRSGAINSGMNKDKIKVVKNTAEAMEYYKTIGGGKVVLFENDLPDNYR